MSSSSTTACSRSPSPSPTTPEASDMRDPIMSQEDFSSWCKSLPNADFLMNTQLSYGDHSRKPEEMPSLSLEDLLQEHVYSDATPVALDVPAESMFCPVTSLASPNPSISGTKPIPPPAQIRKDPPALQRVVFPEKEACSNLPIIFPSLPDSGTKSRVETQIRLTVDLAHASSSSGERFKYDKVGSWKWLRLPKGTTTKKRTRKEGKIDAPTTDTLYLSAEITCATPPHTRVSVCSSCQTREAKRVARKIAARVRPARSDSDSQEEPRVIPGKGKHEDTSNILQFNCPEVLDFSSGSVILPLRITCYCRHHREKVGFNLHLTMLDHTGRVVGTGTTKPIMITDDHKSTGVNSQKSTNEFSSKLDWTVTGAEPQEGATKRKKGSNGSERSKKRAKPYDTNDRVSKLHRQSSSGSLHSPSEMTSAFVTRASSPLQQTTHSTPLHIVTSGASSPPSAFDFEVPCSSTSGFPEAVGNTASASVASPHLATFDPNASIADFLNTTFDVDIPMPDCSDLESPIPSYQSPSHSPFAHHSPSIPRPHPAVEPANLAVPVPAPAVPMPYMMFKHDSLPISSPTPRIHRLIPAAGPTFGGIEVTVLGANFHPSMQLNCVFGSTPSTSTQRWSDNTLVCILPPSVSPGQVHVWFEGMPKEEDSTPPCLFTYTDETDRALMELALQVVGLKMTGKIEDARHIAMRIVGNTGGPEPESHSGISAGGAMQLSSHLLLGRAGDNGDFERVLLDFLALLDVPMVGASAVDEVVSKQTASGQTLLHLATLAKFPSLVKFLLSHGIDIDARDHNGCTALFLAALTSSTACARALVDAGAALDVVNAAGKTPAEVGPVGFFDFMALANEDSSEDGVHESDDGAWGDVDEDSDCQTERRNTLRRRTGRRLGRPLKPRLAVVSTAVELPELTPSAAAEKKALEAGLAAASTKEATVTFSEKFHRTLAQLQYPQGMIPAIPNLSYLNLPGIPNWGALPQIPAVFPVLVPIPQLWGDRKARGDPHDKSDTGTEGSGQVKYGFANAMDWKASWDKWIQQAMRVQGSDSDNVPPPAYTPRETGQGVDAAAFDSDTKAPVADSQHVPQGAIEVAEAEAERIVVPPPPAPRQVGYGADAVAIPEEEVQLYGYRPARKLARRAQKKHDRMLVLFWIPILIIGLTWVLLHTLKLALKAVVALKGGFHV